MLAEVCGGLTGEEDYELFQVSEWLDAGGDDGFHADDGAGSNSYGPDRPEGQC